MLPAPAFTLSPPGGGSGADLAFNFGSISVAPDNNPDDDSFLICFTALLLNEAGNQNGGALVNNSAAEVRDGTGGLLWTGSGAAQVDVVEPELQLSKLANDDTPGLGQTVTYTLVVEHLGSSTADAQDLELIDVLPLGVTYVGGSAAGPPGWSAAYNGLTPRADLAG